MAQFSTGWPSDTINMARDAKTQPIVTHNAAIPARGCPWTKFGRHVSRRLSRLLGRLSCDVPSGPLEVVGRPSRTAVDVGLMAASTQSFCVSLIAVASFSRVGSSVPADDVDEVLTDGVGSLSPSGP
jgi:hypothetical protein